jgi:hypothetical protein
MSVLAGLAARFYCGNYYPEYNNMVSIGIAVTCLAWMVWSSTGSFIKVELYSDRLYARNIFSSEGGDLYFSEIRSVNGEAYIAGSSRNGGYFIEQDLCIEWGRSKTFIISDIVYNNFDEFKQAFITQYEEYQNLQTDSEEEA